MRTQNQCPICFEYSYSKKSYPCAACWKSYSEFASGKSLDERIMAVGGIMWAARRAMLAERRRWITGRMRLDKTGKVKGRCAKSSDS